ncbi:hypothetical protein [Desnuesiella massiliensis]|uniref:hypothetical protein n=1 Tax=Desnuesiella massiliensis TaxID=1650662 RepID=UPI0012B5F5E2|nr:hypothetical protein [Desnuesiella massiliensis]
MKTKYVIVEDYNPEWKNEFERIKNELLTVSIRFSRRIKTNLQKVNIKYGEHYFDKR